MSKIYSDEHNHENSHENSHEHNHEHNHEHGESEENSRGVVIRIAIATVIFAAVLIADKCGMLAMTEGTAWQVILYLVPYVILCCPDIIGELIENIVHGEIFGEIFLMMTASIAAICIGEYSEAIVVMLLFRIGELLEDYVVDKSRDSVRGLMDIAPDFANIEDKDGNVVKVSPKQVEIGSVIVIKAGERIPVDCVVLEGDSFIDTSALTGESVPKHVKKDDTVYSGCINGSGLLKCKSIKAYDDSMVARVMDMAQNAASRKSHAEGFITRFARIYTPAVTLAAVMLAVIPGAVTGNWSEWIRRACTFLVISCPCALVISVPLGFFGGIGLASRKGILVKGSNYLEAASKIETIAFDKTGTITKGEFKVSDVFPKNCTEAYLLETAAALEAGSEHPVAISITEAYKSMTNVKSGKKVSGIKEYSGMGIEGMVNGKKVIAGNARWMEKNKIAFEKPDSYGTIIYVAEEGDFRGSIVISDTVKASAKSAIADMKAAGVRKTVMLSGDSETAVSGVAKQVGIDEFRAELLPGDKVNFVDELIEDGNTKIVAFVGDGINDAPVLARADIGIAMGSLGSDAAIEAADVVIMDDDLSRIPMFIGIAGKTMHIVKENIAFALLVKLVVLILGALGITSMWLAVFADVGVTMLCILNSMRTLNAVKSRLV